MTAARATLLLRLAGPMQAWGTQSRFTVRDTGMEPSKSGVLGLLCAALGKPRDETLEPPGSGLPRLADLTSLTMGVRVDREGSVRMDYHTAGGAHRQGDSYGVITASGTSRRTVVSSRYYLADADFLVGLEGERVLLERLDAALRRPVWQVCLGRKAFVPGVPVHLPASPPLGPGVRDLPLREALASYPWCDRKHDASERRRRGDDLPARRRVVLEDPEGEAVRQDVPLDFAARRFTSRRVTTIFVDSPATDGGA